MVETTSDIKVIGQGSYGCVHRPSLKCKKSPRPNFDYKKYISKTMKVRDAYTELNEYSKLKNADPKNKFHLGNPILCNPSYNKKTIHALQKCNDIDIHKKKYSLLISKYGGEDVHKFFRYRLGSFLESNKVKKVDNILYSILNLLKGVKAFRDHNLIHYDIKPQNILFDSKTCQMKYIDFGLMSYKTTVVEESKHNTNWLGTYHWSYPFECGLMNQDRFMEYKQMTAHEKKIYASNFTKYIIYKKKNDIIKHPDSFELIFTYIDPLYQVPNANVQYQYIHSFFEGMDEMLKKSYEDVLDKIVDSIDIYGLGVTIQLIINCLNMQKAIDQKVYLEIYSFCKKMYDFNLSERETDIDVLIDEYEQILVNNDIHGKNKSNKNKKVLKKNSSISPNLEKIAYLDPLSTIFVKSKTKKRGRVYHSQSRKRYPIDE
jgi:serine/threonine protein kinase